MPEDLINLENDKLIHRCVFFPDVMNRAPMEDMAPTAQWIANATTAEVAIPKEDVSAPKDGRFVQSTLKKKLYSDSLAHFLTIIHFTGCSLH